MKSKTIRGLANGSTCEKEKTIPILPSRERVLVWALYFVKNLPLCPCQPISKAYCWFCFYGQRSACWFTCCVITFLRSVSRCNSMVSWKLSSPVSQIRSNDGEYAGEFVLRWCEFISKYLVLSILVWVCDAMRCFVWMRRIIVWVRHLCSSGRWHTDAFLWSVARCKSVYVRAMYM